MKRKNKAASICWKCRNAVPTEKTGCSWSRDFVPVDGWVVENHCIYVNPECSRRVESYCVEYCPEFWGDPKVEKQQICKDKEACLRLVEAVLRKEMERYRAALNQYSKYHEKKMIGKIRDIERYLMSPHYAALSLHSVDMRSICNRMRQAAGLPELCDENGAGGDSN